MDELGTEPCWMPLTSVGEEVTVLKDSNKRMRKGAAKALEKIAKRDKGENKRNSHGSKHERNRHSEWNAFREREENA